MACDEALKTQAYLDGELDAGQALEIEAHLENCAECQALAADHADLKAAMAGAQYHRAPSALRAKISDMLDAEAKVVPVLIGSAEGDNGVRRLLKALRHEVPEVNALRDRLGLNSPSRAKHAGGGDAGL